VFADAILVDHGTVPALGGGSFSPPTIPAAVAGGPSLASFGGVEFMANCSPTAQLCFSSGIVRIWVDDLVRERLGDVLFLMNAEIDGALEFFDFDAFGVPHSVIGEVRIDGELRARVNSTVITDDLAEVERTGTGPVPAVTTLMLVGNEMVLGATSGGFDTAIEYGVTGIGTSEMLTIRLDGEIEFDNDDGTTSVGQVVWHVRLRA
jgi:hypothetical protein